MDDILRADRVSYRYPQNSQGLEAISLNVQPGEALLIAGPSGCGKSTLARCLTGLIPHLYRGHLSGQVWVGDLCTAHTPLWQLAERAGLVFQNPAAQMLAASVEDEIVFGLENLGLSRDEIGERLEEALAGFGLTPLRGRPPLTLSSGEQQKVALAAAMARRPPVLVLDEPLSMLDSTASLELVAHLAGWVRTGTTAVVCEHRREYLRPLPRLRAFELDAGCVCHGPESTPPLSPCPPFCLQVSHLGVTLGGRPVLRDLSFALSAGQVVALVGRNGVGKTTLLRALAGLQPYTGEVSVEGQRPELALVFQNPDLQLFNPTVRDEILYRLAAPDPARYAWLLEVLGLQPYQETPPLLLSEGEKKRVALATALMRGPRHGILLDEPSLGQDALHKAQLLRLARALADAGRLVLMTTHDLSLAAQADRLLLMGESGLVADGPPSQVLRSPAPWARLGLAVPEWVVQA